jgi:hypothetical protein
MTRNYQDDVVGVVMGMIDMMGMNIFYFYEMNACLHWGTVSVDKQQIYAFWYWKAFLSLRMMALALIGQLCCIDASFALK